MVPSMFESQHQTSWKPLAALLVASANIPNHGIVMLLFAERKLSDYIPEPIFNIAKTVSNPTRQHSCNSLLVFSVRFSLDDYDLQKIEVDRRNRVNIYAGSSKLNDS